MQLHQMPSLPVRGAWIEISSVPLWLCRCPSLPVRGAWIEIWTRQTAFRQAPSLPERGAWIEIALDGQRDVVHGVAPRAGSVD